MRALVIGTYRDEEARLVPELGQLLGDVAREGTYLPLVTPDARGDLRAGGELHGATCRRGVARFSSEGH